MREITLTSNSTDRNNPLARNVNQIAAEISTIKKQTRNMVIYNSIEIGRRLSEAKLLLNHGEWGTWLEQLSYSKSTANNLMRIFDEYGADQLVFLGDNAKSELYGDLSYTQAVAMLGMPDEEKEAFIVEHDLENMSSRELLQALKERDQAQQDKLMAEKAMEQALKRAEDVESSKKLLDEKIKRFDDEKKKLKAEYEQAKVDSEKAARKSLDDAKRELAQQVLNEKELKKQLKELVNMPVIAQTHANEDEIAKTRETVAAEYAEKLAKMEADKVASEKWIRELESKQDRQNNQAAAKYSVYFENLVKDFSGLLTCLNEIKVDDAAMHEKYKKAVLGLIEKMNEHL